MKSSHTPWTSSYPKTWLKLILQIKRILDIKINHPQEKRAYMFYYLEIASKISMQLKNSFKYYNKTESENYESRKTKHPYSLTLPSTQSVNNYSRQHSLKVQTIKMPYNRLIDKLCTYILLLLSKKNERTADTYNNSQRWRAYAEFF